MNHSDIQTRMASYLEGELALGDRARFDGHLDNCEPCSRELAEMRATINLLRRLPTPEPPSDLVEQVMRRIAEGEGQPSWLGRVADALSVILAPRFSIPATALAAGLAITFVSGDLQFRALDLMRPAQPVKVASILPGSSTNSPAAAQQRRPAGIRVNLRIESNSAQPPQFVASAPFGRAAVQRPDGSGAFLYRDRVASEPLGPLRRQARAADSLATTPTRMGPYLGASAVTHQTPTVGDFPMQWTQDAEPFSMSRVASFRTAIGSSDSNPSGLSRTDRRREELDHRLQYLLQDPPGFARGIAAVSLAERELWLRELARRADEIGEFERVELALSSSSDPDARALARQFARGLEPLRAGWAEADVQTTR